jgi:Na+/melibiose symporter-like transporter
VAAVGVAMFPPLLALAALGAYWQYKITEDTWKIIESHIARKARRIRAAAAGTLRNVRRGERRGV